MNNEEKIEILKIVAFKVGGDIRKGYSGRFMHGAQCYGIVCDDQIGCIEWAAEHGLEGANWDDMGKQYIVYWPSIAYDPEIDYANQGQCEDSRPRRLTKDDLARLSPEQRAELDMALLQATEGVSGLIELLDILGLEERNAVHRLALAMGKLEHLKAEKTTD